MTSTFAPDAAIDCIYTRLISENDFSIETYGEPEVERDGLLDSVRANGILVPLVVTARATGWEVLSGHRRLACARRLGLVEVPCQVRDVPSNAARRLAVLEYNRQRRKTFRQMMREADALEGLLADRAKRRQRAALNQFRDEAVRREPDERPGRTDASIARMVGLGGKDQYRQARAVWKAAQSGDARALAAVAQLDDGTKTIHAAHKDLRRRDRFTAGFHPTPYDVWAFRHDRAFGVPHPGSIPPAIIAHTLHYYTQEGDLVVDPMAGGGTTIDVCEAMGRRCLAYDIAPVRSDVRPHDVNKGLPLEAHGCDLIFADPPYHTMLAGKWDAPGVAGSSFYAWREFLRSFALIVYAALRPGGHVALLLANQTERDLPPGSAYLDHAFLGYAALLEAGFVPQRRISCPMQGAYLPQHVRRARAEGRMLGQVRDLLVMRKPETT